MPNGQPFECEVEIGSMIKEELRLKLSANYWEDEKCSIPAAHVVHTGETFYVKVSWWWEGDLAFARHLAGTWQVKIDLESIGTAEEFSSNLKDVKMDPCSLGTAKDPYSHTFQITPGTLQPAEGGTVYLVAVTLSTEDPCGDPGHIWGYCKGPSTMFVKA